MCTCRQLRLHLNSLYLHRHPRCHPSYYPMSSQRPLTAWVVLLLLFVQVSIEMIEAVGHEHLPSYFATINAALKPGGKAVIQVTGCDGCGWTAAPVGCAK